MKLCFSYTIFAVLATTANIGNQHICTVYHDGCDHYLHFSGFEFGFEYLFHSKVLRYIGGTVGLAMGYWIRYQLDKRYAFTENMR